MSALIDKLTSDFGTIMLAILVMLVLIVIALMFASEQGLIDITIPSLW